MTGCGTQPATAQNRLEISALPLILWWGGQMLQDSMECGPVELIFSWSSTEKPGVLLWLICPHVRGRWLSSSLSPNFQIFLLRGATWSGFVALIVSAGVPRIHYGSMGMDIGWDCGFLLNPSYFLSLLPFESAITISFSPDWMLALLSA